MDMFGRLLALAVLGAGVLAPGISFAATLAYVTVDLNLRQGPGTEYARLTTIPGGSQVVVVDCDQPTNWCNVAWNGWEGWVSGAYLSFAGPGYVSPPPVIVEPPVIIQPPYRPYYPYYYGDRYRPHYYGDRYRPRYYNPPRHRELHRGPRKPKVARPPRPGKPTPPQPRRKPRPKAQVKPPDMPCPPLMSCQSKTR
jgi:uncharacterized protein YraI